MDTQNLTLGISVKWVILESMFLNNASEVMWFEVEQLTGVHTYGQVFDKLDHIQSINHTFDEELAQQ